MGEVAGQEHRDPARKAIAWVRERLEGLGLNVPPPQRRTPEYLAKLIPSELEKWAGPVKASGAAVD